MTDLIHGSGGEVIPEQVWDPALNSGQGGMEAVQGTNGAINVALSGSNVTPFTFQNAAGASGNGQVLNTIGYKTLLVSIFGATSPAGTVTFEGAGTDLNFTPYLGAKVGGANIVSVTTASSTTNIPSGTPPQPDLWQFDVSALDQFMCPLVWTAGTVTVKGRLIA